MKKSLFSSLAILACCGLSTFAFGQEAEVGSMAPDFTLTSAMGNKHSLSDFKGKVVVLEWVNHGCPFVVKHYATGNMQKLQKDYTSQDVIWLSICSSAEGEQGWMENSDILEARAALQAASTAYLVDESGEVGRLYRAQRTPEMFVIDASGKIVYHGAIDDNSTASHASVATANNYVVAALNAVLAGQPVATPKTRPYGCTVKYVSK